MKQIQSKYKQKGSPLKKVSQDKIDNVLKLHTEGYSQNHIASTLLVGNKTIRSIIEKFSVIRTKSEQSYYHHKTSTLREDAFDIITDDSAYWLGFLYADGYITNPEKRNTIGILLKGEDEGHLVKFMEFLKAPQEIRKGNTTIQGKTYSNVSVKIGSQKLHSKLMEWGFTHTKSQDAKPPEALKYNRHFWRGVIDGDGYLGIVGKGRKRKRLHIYGTQDMVKGFSEFLLNAGVKHGRNTMHNSKGLPTFEVGDITAVITAQLLYENCNIYLNRKYQRYLEFIK